MLRDYANVLLFLSLGCIFVLFNLLMAWVVRPSRPTPEKLTTYECGEEPIGGAWVQFNIRFYVVALIYIIFSVEIVFMYPWAVVFKDLGLFAFVEMMMFMVILLVGLAYVWKKGDLDWVKPETPYTRS
jgi:NADH-quinone oxidoreductase subunit A